jgi:hypothetical protein
MRSQLLNGDYMDRSNNVPTQSDADARRRREIRKSKPTREWTVEERREAFLEGQREERQKTQAGVVDEWEVCKTCVRKSASVARGCAGVVSMRWFNIKTDSIPARRSKLVVPTATQLVGEG